MLICIYNILGNPVGLKYAAKEERLCDALEECLAPYHTHRIIGTALRIAKYLVDDLSDQTYFITLFENVSVINSMLAFASHAFLATHRKYNSTNSRKRTFCKKIGKDGNYKNRFGIRRKSRCHKATLSPKTFQTQI